MKKIILLMTVILAGFTGCYKNIPLEVPVIQAGLKVVPLDESVLSQEEGDIIVTAHVKKGSYVLSPRTDEDRYTFVFMINDKELIESVKGIEEMESDMHEEKGEGIHYTFKKRLRLKPGEYSISLKTEDVKTSPFNLQLTGGKLYTLRFEPVYGPIKMGAKKSFQHGVSHSFWQGVRDFNVYLNDVIFKE